MWNAAFCQVTQTVCQICLLTRFDLVVGELSSSLTVMALEQKKKKEDTIYNCFPQRAGETLISSLGSGEGRNES